jgi:CubicO group peptidase (beta-lactamase class C family)
VPDYFPPPESAGGWRTALTPEAAREAGGMDAPALERAWAFVSTLHPDSALLVARHGWVCFERYQGALNPSAIRSMHSCGKAYTGVAAAILADERPDVFPHRLGQRVYGGAHLPPEHAPAHDARKAQITLGQLLSMTAGLRGRRGTSADARGAVEIEPPGPDGTFTEHVAFGHAPLPYGGESTSLATLWCDPGGGYSYASAGPVVLGAMVRHLAGVELRDYLAQRVLGPIGWEGWDWEQNPPEPDGARHTKAQGGLMPRLRDAARFGYLLLRGGAWAGRRLIPSWYADAIGRPAPDNTYLPDRGLLVLLNADGAAPAAPGDAYGPAGYADNYVYVVPSLDLVAVRMGGRTGAGARQTVWPAILEAVTAAVVVS